jgi:amidophosphoribosyltransferase
MILDKPREECGIVGVFNHPEAAKLAYLGLYALQHRGQEGAGIVSADGKQLYAHRDVGLVNDVFTQPILDGLRGHMAIGHVRYSTTGSNMLANTQPLLANYRSGQMAVAHNGNIVNAAELRHELENRGAIFQNSTDSEVLLHLIAQSPATDFEEALAASLVRLKGAYSILIQREDRMIALKDAHGIRPLCMGTLDGATIIASESCALDIMDAQYLREIKPGEMVVLEKDGEIRIERPFSPQPEKFCVFEFIYFSRPDSVRANRSISSIRNRLGRQLAIEHPAEADLVIAIPDSSNDAATGYAEQIGLPFRFGLIRNHYIGRTFIEPEDRIRHFGAKIKFNAVKSVLRDQRVIVVDDSVVRGTTGKKIVAMLRRAGAKEVHFRASAPPWRNPCFYGIDTPTEEELIANKLNAEEIAKFMGADSMGYLSVEGTLESVPKQIGYCTACFSGQYDAGKPAAFRKTQHEQRAEALTR